jgi:CRP/FNR family transcriptional regulator, nitrogen oxide reductase regulator
MMALPDAMRSSIDIGAVVRSTTLFRDLPADEQAEFATVATLRALPRGGVLFEQGTQPAEFYVVAEGWVKLTHVTSAGDQIALAFTQRGDHVGGAALVRATPFPATARAASDALLLVWKAALIHDRIARSPGLARSALALVGDRADEYLSRIQELASDPVEVRLARHLTELVGRSGRRTERGVDVEFPISRQDLAELSGTTLFTVSRILTRWRDLGLVDPGRQRIVVRDTARLAEIIGEGRVANGAR